MRTEIKITFKDPTREHGHSTKNYLDVYAGGVLICEAYPRRQADGTTYRIRTARILLWVSISEGSLRASTRTPSTCGFA